MSDQKKHKRSAPISYRPPMALREEFYARLLRSGLSMNAFITQSIFDASLPRQRQRPFEKGDLAHLLGHATRLYDRLREIEPKDGHDGDQSAVIEAAMDDLAIIRASLVYALGRTP